MTETNLHIYQNGVEADLRIQEDDLLGEHHQMEGHQEGMEVEVEALVAVVVPDDGAGGVLPDCGPPGGGPPGRDPPGRDPSDDEQDDDEKDNLMNVRCWEWQCADTPAHDYEDKIIQKALRMIKSAWHMASAYSLETRSFKPAMSNKYNGQTDIQFFEKWLSDLLTNFDLMGLGRATYDQKHILIVSKYLEGDALEWFYQEVQDSNQEKMRWTFPKVIVGLIRCHLYIATSKDADTRYERVSYSLKQAKPQDYDIKKCIFKSIPDWIQSDCLFIRLLTPKDSPLTTIVEYIEALEKASKYEKSTYNTTALSAPPSQTTSPLPVSPIDEQPALPPSSPEPIPEINTMTNVKALPSRRDKATPIFDPKNPQSLLRYLEDLEDLFKAHPTLITNEADKKCAAVKYVPMHQEEMWKGLPEYKDAAKTYEAFVTALKMLYPAVHEDQRYSVGDMDRLVGERVRIGIHNLADLSTFYCEFLLIMHFLHCRDLISEHKQNRAFQHAFSQDLWTKVYTRLQIKNPEQAADTPYGITSVFEAASFFLAGTPATTIMEAKAETPEGKVKVEEYTSLVDIIMKAVSQSLAPTLAAMAQGSTMAAGANMRKRIMEWHRCNPSQVAVNIIEQMIYKDVKTIGAPRDIFQLDINEHIKLLEQELFALRKHPTFDGIQTLPHPDKGKAPVLLINATPSALAVPEKTTVPAPGPLTPSKLHNLPLTCRTHPSIHMPKPEKVVDTEQEHSKELAYHAQAPVYDPVISENVFQWSLSIPYVSLTSQELLAISPEVRNKYCDLVTPKRVPPTTECIQAMLEEVANEELTSPETFLCSDLLTYGKTEEHGEIIVPDPVDQYFKGLAPGKILLHFHVVKESLALRSIVSLVDNKEKVEAILDPGSQIIAMSEGVCLSLGIAFDSMVRVQMQSVNKTVDLTLSLAHNVPFQVGSITLYLQMHVVRDPAYDILLGRPFDVLTQSNI
ncbi:hypothetical protein NEOLEDRAFT_1180548 [Neolentinus lepideus HHB14362 ss-1]|uniref:Uncharacterized protein n=1 Tax=Neolentinus lepideus HHB14362 ss-1 TaxID=1314782 RepID=A0A165QS13_9AGAM|nr:hypothetical protein NEOLEDRAFT_1180548 [Neolentinus lepideus HHB14362 ss-1]